MIRLLDRYEIRGVLDKTSHGVVHFGIDPQTRRQVAVKIFRILPPDLQRTRAVLEAANRVAKIRHPGIVPILEADEVDNDPYVVYEYISGGDLARLLRQGGALSAAKAIVVLRALLEAVAAAHEVNYFNCDLQPKNVLLDASGAPRLVDLGLASRAAAAGVSASAFLGTPAYLAPEFIARREFGAATDVRAAGLLLFEMLTGRAAVGGDSPEKMLDRILGEELRLPENAAVDGRLAALVNKALARDPGLRFQGVRQFAQALDEFLDAGGSRATAVAPGNATLEVLLRRMRHKSDFPALSESVAAINRIASSENERADRLASVILKDFALTNQLLRIVNSVHYRPAGGGSISTVSRAVAVLGFETTRSVALSVLLLEHVHNKASSLRLKEDYVRINLAALLARKLALDTRQQDLEEVFICAMFHGLGQLLAHFYFPEETAAIDAAIQEKKRSADAAAREILGLSFEELGVAVAEHWGFPPVIRNAMKKLPAGSVSSLGTKEDRLRVIAAFANEVCDALAHAPAEQLTALVGAAEARFGPVIGLRPARLQAAVREAAVDAAAYCRLARVELDKTNVGRQVHRYLNPGLVRSEPAVERVVEPAAQTAEGLELGAADGEGTAQADVSSLLAAGIQEISTSLAEQFQLNDILRTVLETMFRAIGFRRVLLCTRDVKTGVMQARYGFGVDAAEVTKRFKFELGTQPDVFSAATDKGIDILIRDTADPAIAARIPLWYRQAVPARSMLLLPINVKGNPVALIYADQDEPDGIRIPEHELALLRTLRNQAILAMKLARG